MFMYAGIIQRRLNEERQRTRRRLEHRHIRDNSDPFDLPAVVFVKLFRLSKETVHFLIESLQGDLVIQRRHGIPIHIKVLAALHFVGHGGYQTTVGIGLHMGLSQPSVSKCLQQVVDAIFTVLLSETVKFPDTEEEILADQQKFLRVSGFPGVLGLIDCTQIGIIRPKDTEQVPGRVFFNRKGFYSLNCQFVCNPSLEIIHVNASFPGSTHDSAIWQVSNLNRLLETRYVDGRSGEWLLGDSGYAQVPWLMTPFAETQENSPEARYNIAHSQTRVGIEKCFGGVKTRFRCLHKHRTLHYDPVKASRIIMAVAVLYNIALRRNDPMPEELEIDGARQQFENPPRDVSFLNAGRRLRDEIARRYFA